MPNNSPQPPATPGGLIHRARWDVASQQITAGAMRGVKAAEAEYPGMECQEVIVEWAEPANFDDQGTAYVNTAEAGATPVKTTYRFARKSTPTLGESP